MADQSKKYKFDISNLNLHYGDFHALKDVNMQIEANNITAFIGPSGCATATFLKTLNRMNELVENCKIDGKVLLDGTDIYKDMDEITLRYRVGMVFQQPNPFPKSVYDNVAYGPRIAGPFFKRMFSFLYGLPAQYIAFPCLCTSFFAERKNLGLSAVYADTEADISFVIRLSRYDGST